jgi:hypothetical protein
MNNYSFLDASQQQQVAQQQQQRPPPLPSHSQVASIAASQVNGGGQNGIPMVNGLPSGGQQTDMNHLWAVVQQLSQLLEENKAQTRGIVEGVAAIQGRAAQEDGGEVGGGIRGADMREVNGELNGMYFTLELDGIPVQRMACLWSNWKPNTKEQQRHVPPNSHTSNPNSLLHKTPSRLSPQTTTLYKPSTQTTNPPSRFFSTSCGHTLTARPPLSSPYINTTRRSSTKKGARPWA